MTQEERELMELIRGYPIWWKGQALRLAQLLKRAVGVRMVVINPNWSASDVRKALASFGPKGGIVYAKHGVGVLEWFGDNPAVWLDEVKIPVVHGATVWIAPLVPFVEPQYTELMGDMIVDDATISRWFSLVEFVPDVYDHVLYLQGDYDVWALIDAGTVYRRLTAANIYGLVTVLVMNEAVPSQGIQEIASRFGNDVLFSRDGLAVERR